jgi:hypothetical protein
MHCKVSLICTVLALGVAMLMLACPSCGHNCHESNNRQHHLDRFYVGDFALSSTIRVWDVAHDGTLSNRRQLTSSNLLSGLFGILPYHHRQELLVASDPEEFDESLVSGDLLKVDIDSGDVLGYLIPPRPPPVGVYYPRGMAIKGSTMYLADFLYNLSGAPGPVFIIDADTGTQLGKVEETKRKKA